MSVIGTIIGAGLNAGFGALNNYWAEQQASKARAENYMYGEMSADNADTRTRALYKDFYSPQALLKQYQAAGLSPSMMFGGTPGQGGMSGAQGSGGAGTPTPYMPMSLLEGAQIANLTAETNKTKAETKNIEKDTDLKELERQMSELTTNQFKDEWKIINTKWEDDEGNQTSLFEMADKYYNFESFLNDVRKDNKGNINFDASSEAEISKLRQIYESASRFNRDITILSQETVSAAFQMSITTALQKKGFADQNAETAVKQLKAAAETSELTIQQKEAWNNLLNKLDKKGSTTKDIIIVLGMILGNFASHTGIKVNI